MKAVGSGGERSWLYESVREGGCMGRREGEKERGREKECERVHLVK